MGSHPLNLALRFMLEVAALISMGLWGWQQSNGWLRWLLALGLPLIAAIIWGAFAVPNDPSRSGAAPIPVSGIIRLAIEAAVFGSAVWALYDVGLPRLGLTLAIIVVLHYAASYDRLVWLLRR